MSLNHANDITYNSKLDRLIVCHNTGAANKVTYINPNDLKITGEKTLDFNIYSIDYNATDNCYVVGESGGESFSILDSRFEKVYTFASQVKPDFDAEERMTQGICCDDKYIYCVLFKPNVIAL